MEGTADQGLLSEGVSDLHRPVFDKAGPGDDAAVRRLLREHAMPGAVSVSLEREPSLRAGPELEGGDQRTLVCREGGRVVGAGGVITRLMLVGGAPQRVAYLGQLRLDGRARGKRGVLLEGYRAMGAMVGTGCVLTSILEENRVARRLLERGLRGMPAYRLLSRFHTFVLGRRMGTPPGVRVLGVSDIEGIARMLKEEAQGFAVAPHWEAGAIGRLLETGTLTMLGVDGPEGLSGCVGVWDLSSVKQTVVRGYSRPLAVARGAINAVGGTLGAPRLPAIGEALRVRFLSHLAARGCGEEGRQRLLAAACELARSQQASVVAGVAPGHHLHALLARHAWNTLASRLYSVWWPGAPSPTAAWPAGEAPVHVEVALL